MIKAQFINRVRSLFNIDGYLLPELTKEQQLKFVSDPVRYFINADDRQADAIMREIERRQKEVTEEFKAASSRAAIKALRGLEQTAIMLETYAPEVFPEVNELGQIHFGRAMMEAAAESIREAWASAIAEVSPPKEDAGPLGPLANHSVAAEG